MSVLKSKAEIDELVYQQYQKTNGMSGEVPLEWGKLVNLSEELAKKAYDYAYQMFPSGGWQWTVAFYDYMENNGGTKNG